jgi:5-methylcytosine-specific restriction endonuclease McrA
MTKTCSRCREVKPLTEFYKDSRGKHGVRPDCKVCRTAHKAARYQANRDAVLARNAAHKQANPHIGWEADYRQRCRLHGLMPVIVRFTRDDVVAQYGHDCFYCETGPFAELDHHIPVAAGGSHTIANARPSCKACNRLKGNTTDRDAVADFRQSPQKEDAETIRTPEGSDLGSEPECQAYDAIGRPA